MRSYKSFGNFNLTLGECLHDTWSVSIHTQNLKYLMPEAYKSLHHLNPEFMFELFLPKVFYGIPTVPDYILKVVMNVMNIQIKKKCQGVLCNCRICSR